MRRATGSRIIRWCRAPVAVTSLWRARCGSPYATRSSSHGSGPDVQVGAWVPVDMRERYDNSWGEVTTGHARYSNYRRFRTSGRLVRPGG